MTTNEHARRTLLRRGGTLLSVGASSITGCLGSLDEPTGRTVTMTAELRFDPDEIRIETGQQVTWENESQAPHTASAYEESIPDDAAYFASGEYESERAVRQSTSAEGFLERGETYSNTFDVTGTYRYFCLPHEESGMTGTIVVE